MPGSDPIVTLVDSVTWLSIVSMIQNDALIYIIAQIFPLSSILCLMDNLPWMSYRLLQINMSKGGGEETSGPTENPNIPFIGECGGSPYRKNYLSLYSFPYAILKSVLHTTKKVNLLKCNYGQVIPKVKFNMFGWNLHFFSGLWHFFKVSSYLFTSLASNLTEPPSSVSIAKGWHKRRHWSLYSPEEAALLLKEEPLLFSERLYCVS